MLLPIFILKPQDSIIFMATAQSESVIKPAGLQMAIVSPFMRYGGIFTLLGSSTSVDEKLSDSAFNEPITKNAADINFFLCMKVGCKLL